MKINTAICKEVAEREAANEHEIHKKKLMSVRGQVDNKPPRAMPHLNNKAKKELEELKVQAEIHYNNQVLLEKLKKIEMHSAKALVSPRSLSGTASRAKLDQLVRIGNENNKILHKIKSAKCITLLVS